MHVEPSSCSVGFDVIEIDESTELYGILRNFNICRMLSHFKSK